MGRLCLAWDWNDGRLSNSCGWKWIWEGARIHWCQAPHPCVVLGARVGRETSGCSPVFLPWASQAVGHLPSGMNPSLLSIARKGHFRAEEEKIAVTWPPLSHPKPFTPRGFPWLCSTQGWARRPGYTPAAECMPQSLAAGEAAGKESCCLVTQSCLTLCNPVECSTPGFPVHEISHGGVDCCFLLQGILPTQGLPHYRKIVYPWATWKTPGKGRIAPKPGTRFNHSQLILLKTAGSQDPDARPKGCKKLVRQRPCHKWNRPQCMTWLPGWVCMRPGHPVSPGKAVTCVLSHLVAGARPFSSSSSPLLAPTQTDGLKLYWVFLPERIFSHSPCLSQFRQTVTATKFKLFPERQSLGGPPTTTSTDHIYQPKCGALAILPFWCIIASWFSLFQMERNFIWSFRVLQ